MATSISWEQARSRSKKRYVIQITLVIKYGVDEQQKYTPTVLANSQVSFVVLSDVWLDNPRTIPALRKLFEGYAQAVEYKPMAFILCGNFCQKGWEGEGGLKRYTSMCPSRKWTEADK